MREPPPRHRFRLYVAGDAPSSRLARTRLERLCRERLGGAYRIEIVDVMRDARRALSEGVLLAPQVVQLSPRYAKLPGSLDDEASVLATLSLEPS